MRVPSEMMISSLPVGEATADVSVVIPHYNSAELLGRALTSASRQSLHPREVLVVDDGSTPRELEVASRVVSMFEGARLIALPDNVGAGSARNVGWDLAKGTWVAFLDADDAWHPRKLELQLRCAAASGLQALLLACSSVRVQSLQELSELEVPSTVVLRTHELRQLLFRNQFSTSSVMIWRTLPLRFPERSHAEDWETWIRALAMGVQSMTIEYPLQGRFKSVYGMSGLSAEVSRMAIGEYVALRRLTEDGTIGLLQGGLSAAWLTARIARRMTMVALQRCQRS